MDMKLLNNIKIVLVDETTFSAVLQDGTILSEVIRRRKNDKGKFEYAVFSEKGKKIGRWYTTAKAAASRLRQIEFFKHKE
jgi:hypothetical protein